MDEGFRSWLKLKAYYLNDTTVFALVALITVVAVSVALLTASAHLYLIAAGIAIIPLYLLAMWRKKYIAVSGLALFFAAVVVAVTLTATLLFPERAGSIVAGGAGFREETYGWIQTGTGPEVAPGLYNIARLKETGVFAVVSALTGGVGGLVMIAMRAARDAYVWGRLFGDSGDSLIILLLGWPLWRIFGLLGYANLAVGLGSPLTGLIYKRSNWFKEGKDFVFFGLILLFLDAFLHWQLAPFWRELLNEALITGVIE
ncbi:MAG: hypothetical protein GY771_06020 [bacterium]|nr:hypothetical protein [bacterium]